MKRNVVAFLGKDGAQISDLQSTNNAFTEYSHPDFSHNNMVLTISKSSGPVEWASLFTDYAVPGAILNQSSVKGALFVKVNNRYVVFTFGHGRSLINKDSVERGFGLRISMNLGDPEQLKSIDKSTLERVTRNTRAQVAANSSIQDFDFEFDHEILKSMTAIINRPDDELEMISGKDSVSLYTDVEFSKFQEVANRLIAAYSSEEYKNKYPWAEFIRFEVDPAILSDLNKSMLSSLNERKLDDFWLAPPSIVNYEDFSGFGYSTTQSKKSPICKHAELDLAHFLAEAPFKQRCDITLTALKRKCVYLFNGANVKIDEFPIMEALNGEVEYQGVKYILNEGQWYQISESFAKEVESFFEGLPRWSGLNSTPYKDKKECCYLRRIADGEQVAVLDQHWVRNKEIKQNYEFCDLLTQCNRIIHVKHYGGSSVLSHLFAQATNGIEMLLNSPEVIPQVQEYLEGTYLSFEFEPKKKRVHKVVLAIIQERDGDVHMPFLSKVNLRHHARGIINRGFIVELAKIPVDKVGKFEALAKNKCKCKSKTANATKLLNAI